MTTSRCLAVTAVASFVFAATGVGSAAAQRESLLRIATIPATPGVQFVFGGRRLTAPRNGKVVFAAPNLDLRGIEHPLGLARLVRFVPVRRPDGSVSRLERWYLERIDGERTLVAAVSRFVPTRIRLVNGSHLTARIPDVDTVVLKRSDGGVVTFSGERLRKPVTLQATRVVTTIGGARSKNMLYRVLAATIDGNNLVNRAQQAFYPAVTPNVTLKLLFYSAHFVARDRLFGFATGSSLELQYPNGRIDVHRLDDSGSATFPALPRGTYHVSVNGPGLRVRTPVAMTRDQVATLTVVSYLDIGVIGVALLAVGAGLIIVGRPRLRRSLVRFLVGRRRNRLPEAHDEVLEA